MKTISKDKKTCAVHMVLLKSLSSFILMNAIFLTGIRDWSATPY